MPEPLPAITSPAPEIPATRKQVTAALSDQERLQLAVENAFDLVSEVDAEGYFCYTSPNYQDVLGYADGVLVGLQTTDLIHQDDVARLGKEWEHHLSGRLPRVDFRMRHFDGAWRWFEGAGRAFQTKSGDIRYVFTSRDVTERRRHEAELAAMVSLGRIINSHRDIREQMAEIARSLKPFLPFDDFFVTVPDNNFLKLFAGEFTNPVWVGFSREHSPEAGAWTALDENVVVVENDYKAGPGWTTPVKSFINVPLRIEGKAIGLLHLDSNHAHTWSADHIQMAGLVGEQVAGTVWHANQLERSRRQEAALAESNALLQATQEAAADGICLVNPNGQVVSYNRRFAEIWGLEYGENQGAEEQSSVMAHVLEQLADPDEFIEKITYLFDNPQVSSRDEILLRDGRYFERYSSPASSRVGTIERTFGRVWSFSDISDRKQYEERLTHQAFHDGVTGLPNRLLFMDRLSRALAKTERSRRMVAVLFLDLDRFKVVNDTLGHERGDMLLIQVADRLSQCLRPGDTAARFGGDEFVVLLEEVSSAQDATRVADRIESSLKTPFHLDEHEMQVTASIGIVLSESSHEAADDLLRKADIAMYRAKHRGRAHYEIFTSALSEQTLARLKMELELGGVLKRQELQAYYQPLVDLRTGMIGGFEALTRWKHPQQGIIMPAHFIPVAEETGVIVPIGRWILEEACNQGQEWSERFGRPLKIHVNLSVKQLEHMDLLGEIRGVLRDTRLPAHQLVLEVTESAFMVDATKTSDLLKELKNLGVTVAIDDFGTGYSSLSYLEFLPIDSLKIDRSFVRRLSEGTAVVKAVAMLGQAMNVEVSAEGIEERAQLEHLLELECHWGQGFLFGKPQPARESAKLLQSSQPIIDYTWRQPGGNPGNRVS